MRELRDPAALQRELVHVTGALHNTNLQRADRMSMAFGLEARVPFLDVESVALALDIPAAWKLRTDKQPEKALLRQAFADRLPEAIVMRPKQKYAAGAGSVDTIARLAEDSIADDAFAIAREQLETRWSYRLLNKEALYYYDILRRHYSDAWILPEMGRSRSLLPA